MQRFAADAMQPQTRCGVLATIDVGTLRRIRQNWPNQSALIHRDRSTWDTPTHLEDSRCWRG
jgi:hypothetical protein